MRNRLEEMQSDTETVRDFYLSVIPFTFLRHKRGLREKKLELYEQEDYLISDAEKKIHCGSVQSYAWYC